MDRVCKNCGETFNASSNNTLYCDTCKAHMNSRNYYACHKESIIQSNNKYKEKIMLSKNLSLPECNSHFREKTAENKGMTVSEYNRYLEQRKAEKLNISVKDLRHYTYISKKTKTPLYSILGLPEEVYKKLLRG